MMVDKKSLQALLRMKGDVTPYWGGYDLTDEQVEVRLGRALERGGSQKVLLRFPLQDCDLPYITRCIDEQLGLWGVPNGKVK